MPNGEERSDWQAVIAKALAYLCINNTEMKAELLGTKAKFLKGLGLSTADAAGILNTTPASLYELDRQARRKKGAKSGQKKRKTK
jgi:hypothetical protein